MPTINMKYFENLILLVLLINLNLEQNLYLALNENWILTWSEHFEESTLKPSVWNIGELVSGYTCYDKNYQISEKKLYLTTQKLRGNSSNACKIRSTAMETRFGVTYGKFEINASVQYNRAVAWVTLWPIENTYGSGRRGQPSGLIHIFRQNNQFLKHRRKHTSFGVMYGYGFDEYKSLNSSLELPLNTGFHLFSFEWNKTDMIWKIDENIVNYLSIDRYLIKSIEASGEERYAGKGQPFDHKFKLQLTDQFFPNTKYDDLDDNFTESKFIIDYVKYFALNGSEILQNSTSADNDDETNNSIFNTFSISLVSVLLIILIIMPVLFVLYSRKVKRNTKLKNKFNEEDYADVLNTDYENINIAKESVYEDVVMTDEVNAYYEIDESRAHIREQTNTDKNHEYLDIF